MKTIRTLVAAALLLTPAAGLSAEGKAAAKDEAKAGAATTAGKGAPAGQPAAPAKEELDVSRMFFDAESIRQVVRHHMPEIQECYEKVLADTGKKIEGRVVVGLIIDTNGIVSEARVLPKKSSLKDDRVHDCVLAIRRWFFPKPGDNRDHPIEYPFDLKVKQ